MSAPRIKDASFIQQHIEKLILLAGILVFAVAVFLFVLSKPFAVEVNRQKHADPKDAVEVLVRTDTRIERGLQEPKPLPVLITPDFQQAFQEIIDLPITDQLAEGLSNPGITEAAENPDIPDPSRYALVYPPVPKNVTHVSGTDVLDKEFDPKLTKEYFDLWGKEIDEPGDFTMFVAAGEFDVSEWANRLKAEAPEGESIQIPAGIWVQRFGISGVALLREEFDPVEQAWGSRQIVTPLPGQVRILPDEKVESETTQAMMQIASLREAQLELAQPELPWLTDFVQVTAPGGDEAGVGADGFLLELTKLGPSEKKIIELEEKIEQLRERQERQRERERPGGGADRPPTSFDDRPDRPDRTTERRDPIERQIQNLQEKIDRLRPQAQKEADERQRLEELERRREEERIRREALRSERDRALLGPDQYQGPGIEGLNLQEDTTLRVWAADPSMQPGKTYRYKLLVSVINPLYAVPRLAPDQLEENKQRASLLPTDAEIASMQWIGPIKVEPESQFFFTSNRGLNGARIEIYRRVNGELRMQDFSGDPGDVIGKMLEVQNNLGQNVAIDMNVNSILVDVERRNDVLSGRTIYNMIYMDANGDIHERIDAIDKSSPARKELQRELKDGPDRVLRPSTDDIGPGNEFGPGGPGGFDPNFRDF